MFTFWSQLAQYSTNQNQRHFNQKQKNCGISAKTLQMLQKWILFIWTVTLYCLNYKESDYEFHTTTEGYPFYSSYRPRLQAPQQYTGPVLFLPFLHSVQILWDTATFNGNSLSWSKCADMKTWHSNTRKIYMQRNVQMHHLYNQQKHGRQIKKLYCRFLNKKRNNQKMWVTLARLLWQINWR